MRLWSKMIDGKETGVEIIDERAGSTIDESGYVQPTYNCYAGIGYELDDTGKRTGRIIAWAGNNSAGEIEYVTNIDLDAYLSDWHDDWPGDFRREGVLIDE